MKQLKSGLALILSIVLFAESVPAVPIAPSLPSNAFNITLPEQLGFITDAHKANSAVTRPDVILIQDLHVNRSVQRAISSILKTLQHQNLLPERIAVEGAYGSVPVEAMQKPDPALRRQAADYMVSQGEMPGAMHFVVTEGRGGLYGIETDGLYKADVEAFRHSYIGGDSLRAQLARLKKALPTLAQNPATRDKAVLLGKDITAAEAFLNHQVMPQEMESTLSHLMVALDHFKKTLPADSQNLVVPPLSAAVQFYALASLRDQALFNHSMELRAADRQTTTVIVAGGFHTQGLTEQMKRLGLSYAVITPSVRELSRIDENLYVARLLGRHLSAEEARSGLDWASMQMLAAPMNYAAGIYGNVIAGIRVRRSLRQRLTMLLLAVFVATSSMGGCSPKSSSSLPPLHDTLVSQPSNLPDATPSRLIIAPDIIAALNGEGQALSGDIINVTGAHALEDSALVFTASGPRGRRITPVFTDANGLSVRGSVITWIQPSPQRFMVKLGELHPPEGFDWTRIRQVLLSASGPVEVTREQLVDLRAIRQRGFALGVFAGGIDVETTPKEMDDGNQFAPYNGLDRRIDERRKPFSVLSFTNITDDPQVLRAEWNRLASNGQTPFDTIEFKPEGSKTDNTVLARIADGKYDDLIRAQAQAVKAFGKPIMIRIFHEFNGDWYPWSIRNKEDIQHFVDAWLHVQTIFNKEEANNARWVFAPVYYESPSLLKAENNERYSFVAEIVNRITNRGGRIDLMGLSVYQKSEGSPGFNEAATGLLDRLSGFSVPIVIAEFASADESHSPGGRSHKAGFWRYFRTDSANGLYPEVVGGFLFDIRKHEGNKWLDFRPEPRDAEELESDSYFARNPLSDLLTHGTKAPWSGSISVSAPAAAPASVASKPAPSGSETSPAATKADLSFKWAPSSNSGEGWSSQRMTLPTPVNASEYKSLVLYIADGTKGQKIKVQVLRPEQDPNSSDGLLDSVTLTGGPQTVVLPLPGTREFAAVVVHTGPTVWGVPLNDDDSRTQVTIDKVGFSKTAVRTSSLPSSGDVISSRPFNLKMILASAALLPLSASAAEAAWSGSSVQLPSVLTNFAGLTALQAGIALAVVVVIAAWIIVSRLRKQAQIKDQADQSQFDGELEQNLRGQGPWSGRPTIESIQAACSTIGGWIHDAETRRALSARLAEWRRIQLDKARAGIAA
jgi:hypothetical protein